MPVHEAKPMAETLRQPVPGKYLEFRRLPELIDHLGERGVNCVHLDDSVKHDPTNHDGIGSVAVYAVVSQDLGTHVAVWGQMVGRELDVFLQGTQEMEVFRTKVQDRLEQVRTLLTAKGLQVLPGRWSHQPPHYL